MKIVKFTICLLFGLMFINAGLNKFFQYTPVPELPENLQRVNEAFTTIKWLLPLVATVEIIGGTLFIIPKTRALGAIMILPVLVGILLHHSIHAPEGLPMVILLFIILLWILIDNSKKYKTLIL